METMTQFLAELTEWTLDGNRSRMRPDMRRWMQHDALHLSAGKLGGTVDSIAFVAGSFVYYRAADDE